jgi:hypothetical protein
MRNPLASNPRIVSGFTTPGQKREWITRYVAVYQDKNHAGQNVKQGGIAPGTVLDTGTPDVPVKPTNLKAVQGVY